MTVKITLTVTEGKLQGKEFAFDGRMLCTVGRSEECHIHLPNEREWLDISRRHCLLDIDPPEVRVCDLGSRNGTYVNNVKIGAREPGSRPGEGRPPDAPEVLLRDGDEVRVGGVVFRVGVVYPLVCTDCGTEMHDEELPVAAEVPLCDWCRLAVAPAAAHPETACAAGSET
jgi:pSer/pThr/pTyr-binding forkhead associated (FHA) protein